MQGLHEITKLEKDLIKNLFSKSNKEQRFKLICVYDYLEAQEVNAYRELDILLSEKFGMSLNRHQILKWKQEYKLNGYEGLSNKPITWIKV